MSENEPNSETRFESYYFTYKWRVSQAESRTSKPEALVCPENIKSPLGCRPATTWRLEALKETEKNYTVVLTLISPGPVWVCVIMSSRVWKGTRNIFVNPHCTGHETTSIETGESLTGDIPKNRFTTSPSMVLLLFTVRYM